MNEAFIRGFFDELAKAAAYADNPLLVHSTFRGGPESKELYKQLLAAGAPMKRVTFSDRVRALMDKFRHGGHSAATAPAPRRKKEPSGIGEFMRTAPAEASKLPEFLRFTKTPTPAVSASARTKTIQYKR